MLFTCASSRVIHLELTRDMLIPSFIRAVKRFVSRRGMPDRLTSDNFKTFNSVEVKNYFVKHGVKQSFILPASPWWGGFYERLLRSVKLTLLKTFGKSFLTFEELETILCEIEYFINCRALVYTSSDDLRKGLAPFHLMYGRNLIDHKLKEKYNGLIPESTNILKMVRKLQDKISCYWSSFANR